jgi:hypothetical protein
MSDIVGTLYKLQDFYSSHPHETCQQQEFQLPLSLQSLERELQHTYRVCTALMHKDSHGRLKRNWKKLLASWRSKEIEDTLKRLEIKVSNCCREFLVRSDHLEYKGQRSLRVHFSD